MFFSTSAVSEEPAWIPHSSGTTQRLQAISAVNEDVVWVSGLGGTYVRTVDGGATWTAAVVSGADTLQFRDVHAFDAETAFLLSSGAGDLSRIYKTTDAGANWEEKYVCEEADGFLDGLGFWDTERGVVFGDAVVGRLMILTTSDGGANWQRVSSDHVPKALPDEAAFAASGTCLAVGDDGRAWIGTGGTATVGRVYRTDDFGRSWDVFDTPLTSSGASSGIFTVAFRDNANGVALGGDYQATEQPCAHGIGSENGGATWSAVGAPPLTGAVYGATYVPGAGTPTLIAVGPSGSAYSRDEGTTWTRLGSDPFWSVAAINAKVIWAVGPDGRVLKLSL